MFKIKLQFFNIYSLNKVIYYLKYIRQYMYLFVVILFLTIIGTLLLILSPYLLKLLVDDAIVNANKNNMILIISMMAVSGILGSIIAYFTTYCNGLIAGKLMIRLRGDLFRHIILLPQDFFRSNKSGEIVQRIYDEINVIQNFISNCVVRFVNNMLLIIGCVFSLCMLNYKLFIVICLILPISILIQSYFRPYIKDAFENIRVKDSEILSFFIDKFNNIKIIQAYNTYDYENKKLSVELQDRFTLGMRGIKLNALNANLLGLFFSVTVIILFSYGGIQVINKELTIGGFIAFINYLVFFMKPVKDMHTLYVNYIRVIVSIDRVNDILKIKNIEDTNHQKCIFKFKDKIKVLNLSYKYDDTYLYSNLQLEFRKRKTYAIVGSSGCGKTTLINLLMKFHNFTKGDIQIDGISIKNIDIFSLRERIGYISQDNFLTNDSILENIKRGNLNSTEDEIISACQKIGINESISNIADKLHMKSGNAGLQISGGEKQRIAIARVFIKDCDILILDEAFASLDAYAEMSIFLTLKKKFSDCLIIVVSHRLTTIKYVDEVVFIQKNATCCQGTHKNLIESNHAYSNFFKEQIN